MKLSIVLLLGLLLASVSTHAKEKWVSDLDALLNDAVDYLDEKSNAIDEIVDEAIDAAKVDVESAEVITAYFERLIDGHDNGLLPIKNSTCIARHCSGQITACVGNTICRDNMMCASGCG